MDRDPIQELSASLDALLQSVPRASAVVAEPAASPEPVPVEAAPTAAAASGRTILIVEDNKDYRSLVRYVLSSHAYLTMEAADGQSALSMLLRQRPDLVILDFNMPRMNGYELLQEIRSRNELRDLPIIMFTGAPNRQHLKSLDLDVADFLEKPVSNSRLLESVDKALRCAPHIIVPGGAPKAPIVPLPSEETSAESETPPPEAAAKPPSMAPPLPAAPPALEDISEETAEWTEDQDIAVVGDEEDKKKEEEEMTGLEQLAHDSPIINRVNRILMRAVEMRASDIHIEPGEGRVMVRVRVDGALKQLCTMPSHIHPRLTARIKIMSNLSITERRLPQDGQFHAQIKGSKIEFRVSTLPCTRGEKIVMRVLGQSKLKGDLYSLGMSPRDLTCIERSLRSPHGLILVTGPTGSGKTTTLYTMISVLNEPDVNIMTAEDPVEYELADISQVKIRPTIGLTFESTLRAFLRQDPDIMLIGEIRDLETAEIAVKASITGHLVLSTLHTNSAAASILRLTHMGVAPYLVAASVRLVIAQRLVRLLCPSCKAEVAISDDDKRFLTEAEAAQLQTVYRSAGCPACHQTGFIGRKPVFEVMPVESSAIRELIVSDYNADMLQELVQKEGLTTLRQAALQTVASGDTSIAEALKIIMGG
ncbi:MAG: ATPase, T2SS/T4P/T4SS family [Elusimicrobiota bacterium]|jgi:type IV pilus assembly protein PilB